MEDNGMRTAIEMQEDDNGGAVEMQDNGYGRKGRSWRREAENCSGVDAGQQGQWRQRYRKMDTAAE